MSIESFGLGLKVKSRNYTQTPSPFSDAQATDIRCHLYCKPMMKIDHLLVALRDNKRETERECEKSLVALHLIRSSVVKSQSLNSCASIRISRKYLFCSRSQHGKTIRSRKPHS